MIDARDAEEVEGFANVGGRAFLSRVRHSPQPLGTCARKDRRKLRWRIAELGGIESDRDETILERQRFLERRHRGVGAQMSQKAQNQLARNRTIAQRGADSIDDGFEGDVALLAQDAGSFVVDVEK